MHKEISKCHHWRNRKTHTSEKLGSNNHHVSCTYGPTDARRGIFTGYLYNRDDDDDDYNNDKNNDYDDDGQQQSLLSVITTRGILSSSEDKQRVQGC